jgi:hypothetical protein
MKKLIPNISKMAMGGEPPKGIKPPVRDTMFVSDLKDPRLKSYQDSTKLSKLYTIPKGAYNIKKYKPEITASVVGTLNNLESFSSKNAKDRFAKDKIKPYRQYNTRIDYPAYYFNGQYIPGEKNAEITGFEYKKPVQPVAYRPKVTPTVNNKKIQMETTKIDTTPVVQPTPKTPPTPLTKKQYYEVPDANGKITLLTPEQFSRMSSGNKNDLMSKSPIMNKPKYFYEMNSSGKRQLVPESKIREYMQTKNK